MSERRLGTTLMSVVAVIVAWAGPAGAHNYPGSDGHPGPCGKSIKWGTASHSYYYPLVVHPDIASGISNAASNMNAATQFTWTYSSSSPNTWTNLLSSDTSIAGATDYVSVNCTPTPGAIARVAFYYNSPHFSSGHGDAGTTTRKNAYQCTAVHEFGHGTGLAHNATSPSIMYTNHATRCHTNQWRTVQPHDVSDIDTKY